MDGNKDFQEPEELKKISTAITNHDDGKRKHVSKATRSKSVDEKHKEYTCSHCKRIFKNKTSFTIHLRFECNQNISSAASTPRAEEEVPRERYRCDHCGRSYKYEKSLPLHIRFECDQRDCPSSVRIPNNDGEPNTGKEEQNTEVKPVIVQTKSEFTCSNCGHVFMSQNSLKYHLRFDCEEKDYTAASTSVSENIAPVEFKERFECKKCDRSYKYEKSLMLHLKLDCGKDERNDEN